MITVWKQHGNDFSSELPYDDGRKRRYKRMKRKTLPVLLVLVLLMTACRSTPEKPIVVQKDSERLVESALNQNTDRAPSVEAPFDEPGFTESDKHYQYDYVSTNGRLTIHADANVYLPNSGRVPMTRVVATGFSDEFIKTAFDRIFQGKTAWKYNPNSYIRGKKEVAEMIVYYQELVDTGRTDEKLMEEDEALDFIEELKKEYETAPEEAIRNDPLLIVDGSVSVQEYDTGLGEITVSHMMDAHNDDHSLQITTNTTKDGFPKGAYFYYQRGNGESFLEYSGNEEGFTLGNWYNPHELRRVETDEMECSFGQSLSPAEAVDRCKEFLKNLDVTDIMPYRTCDLYTATVYDRVKSLYIINFVRTACGTPTAYVSIMNDQVTDPYSIPWYYETIQFFVDDDGVRICLWNEPIEVKEVISIDVQTISYEEAVKIFETMCSITYEAKTTAQDGVTSVYYDLYPNAVELCLLRIKEKDSTIQSGFYVPVWVFYGKVVKQYIHHEDINPDGYLDMILFAINAIDGSIIDIQKGY